MFTGQSTEVKMIVWLQLLAAVATVIGMVAAKLPLEDATATVNQLFSYKIDAKDFPVQALKVNHVTKCQPLKKFENVYFVT